MRHTTRPIHALLLAAMLAGPAFADADDWRSAESGILTDHVQLTHRERFVKAGEAYFNRDGRWIIFQAVPVPEDDDEPDTDYSMYVAKVKRDANGAITGLEEPILISEKGSANTCGFFSPVQPDVVIFGSTIVPPERGDQPGYQRGTGRYRWAFPPEMQVCWRIVPEIHIDMQLSNATTWSPRVLHAQPIFDHPGGYAAECAFSPDGRFIVYAAIDEDEIHADLWVYDTTTKSKLKIVEAPGYDGGPFFSPDGKRICYRSDRDGNNLLQLFVADLAFDNAGAITGIEAEHQLTDNRHVNWAPFWDPTGTFLVYASSEVGHDNYEVFAIDLTPDIPPDVPPEERRRKRITHAAGFDGLPVFSPGGQYLMWTSQRGGTIEGEERPSSQVWAARVLDIKP